MDLPDRTLILLTAQVAQLSLVKSPWASLAISLDAGFSVERHLSVGTSLGPRVEDVVQAPSSEPCS